MLSVKTTENIREQINIDIIGKITETYNKTIENIILW